MKMISYFAVFTLSVCTLGLGAQAHAWGKKPSYVGTHCETPRHFRATVDGRDNGLGAIFTMIKKSGVEAPLFKTESLEIYAVGEATLRRSVTFASGKATETFIFEMPQNYDAQPHHIAQRGPGPGITSFHLHAPKAAKFIAWLIAKLEHRPSLLEFVPPFMPWPIQRSDTYPTPTDRQAYCTETWHMDVTECYIVTGLLDQEHESCYPSL